MLQKLRLCVFIQPMSAYVLYAFNFNLMRFLMNKAEASRKLPQANIENKEHLRSTLVSRNVVISGRRTSVRLEPEMWDALREICQRERSTIHQVARRYRCRSWRKRL